MAEATFSLDLHVLSPPLTFALSQDQTLHRKFEPWSQRRFGSHRSGGNDGIRRGFGFCIKQKPKLSDLACYPVFRDRSPTRASSSSVPTASTVEGCCLYGMTFRSSTVIEKIFHRPARARQTCDLASVFREKNSTRSHARAPTWPAGR
jgi:hypothetical protein